MPALLSPTSKVLLTGPNGYIGQWVVKTLLDRGYTVRAAVRSESRANDLKTLFPSAGDKLEFAIVEDMLKVRTRFPTRFHDEMFHLTVPLPVARSLR